MYGTAQRGLLSTARLGSSSTAVGVSRICRLVTRAPLVQVISSSPHRTGSAETGAPRESPISF